jgi:hypothetical protein
MKTKQLIISTFTYLFVVSIYLILPSQSYAQVVFTDDFSNGYEQWQDVRSTFDLWTIVDERANVFVNTRSTLAELIPKNEFWDNNWKNYIYKLDYIYIQGADKLLSFWYKDTLNWYQFHFVGNNYILSHIKNGVEVWKHTGELILISGTTYSMEVHLDDGNIKFILDGNQILNITDPTFDNDHGTIGIKSGAGSIWPTHVQFDSIQVSLISDIKDFILPINLLKQTDPLWKDVEYDSASIWAKNNTGIGAWGCLVTSINMVLDHHEIYNFTDGTKITPQSLNNWLNSQSDGYIGPGLVNWSAITRLVKQIHDLNGTVNLEYSRAGNNIQTAITEIKNNNPVILDIPGHFVVGNGFNQLQDDLYISDPAYSRTLLSEHPNQLKSTRLLTPSNTDLSYIHISHNNDILTTIKNDQGNLPDTYQSFSQTLSSYPDLETSQEYKLHEFAKPESGIYELEVINNTEISRNYTITIFAYDIDANLIDLTYSGIIGTNNNPTILKINYNKQGETILSNNSSYQQLLNDIIQLKDQNEIKKHYVAYELNQLTNAAIHANTENKPRYINAIKSSIQWYSDHISDNAVELLNQRLLEISTNF